MVGGKVSITRSWMSEGFARRSSETRAEATATMANDLFHISVLSNHSNGGLQGSKIQSKDDTRHLAG